MFPLGKGQKKVAQITQHHVESQESWFGAGFVAPVESDFYTIDFEVSPFTEFEEGIFTLAIVMSKDVVWHNRQIYSLLELLGDIGGLSDALLIIGKIIMVGTIAIKGNQLDDFLLENIFSKQPTEPS